jgi:putative DNA-invertase from lambdoid prophage Rac
MAVQSRCDRGRCCSRPLVVFEFPLPVTEFGRPATQQGSAEHEITESHAQPWSVVSGCYAIRTGQNESRTFRVARESRTAAAMKLTLNRTYYCILSQNLVTILYAHRMYARVSTMDQSCDMQLREMRAYCEARSWITGSEYVDTGWSGAKASRPELKKLLNAARTRKIDCILVWKLDRWGRSVVDCLGTIQELTSIGVQFIAITQGIDTDKSNPMAKLFTTILAAVAEMEREMIRDRVLTGIRAAQAAGKHCGRPEAIFDRRKAREMRNKGMSWRAIAAHFDVSHTTIKRLCN